MKKYVSLLCLILIGLTFQSCNNETSKENEELEQNQIENSSISDVETDTSDNQLVGKIKAYLSNRFLTDGDKRAITKEQRKFQYYKVDLNNDDKDELFISFQNSYFCGTGGCTMLLLDNEFELITRFSPTRALYIKDEMQNGWNILSTKIEGKWRNLIYKNETYPSNPTIVEISNNPPSTHARILFDNAANKSKSYSF